MKKLITILFFTPFFCVANDISEIYWSNYACGGYIYHFDVTESTYRIYTRLDVKNKKKGEYKSYQLAEGEMQKISANLYSLSGKYLVGENSIDFENMDQAILSSTQYGRVVLIQCDSNSAKQLISEAEKHFKTCSKDLINCGAK